MEHNSITQAMNCHGANELRKQFYNNEKPEGCSLCWDIESAGGTSKRMESNAKYMNKFDDTIKPVYLDLKFGILEKELRDISYTKRNKHYTEVLRDDLTEFQVNPGMAWSVNDRFNKQYEKDPYFDKIARTIKEHHVPDFDKKELLDFVKGWSRE